MLTAIKVGLRIPAFPDSLAIRTNASTLFDQIFDIYNCLKLISNPYGSVIIFIRGLGI